MLLHDTQGKYNNFQQHGIEDQRLITLRVKLYHTLFSQLKLKGLDPQKRYRIREINMYNGTKSTLDERTLFSGDFLMKIGFNPDITIERSSVVLEINEVK